MGRRQRAALQQAEALPTANRLLPTSSGSRRCRYLVRRPVEVFLAAGEVAPVEENADDNLSQEELLRRPVYIPQRPLKDPRTILMLDPACGSMHFGLYAI